MKDSELPAFLRSINTVADGIKAEVGAVLEKLNTTDPDISPEGKAELDKLKNVTDAIDAVLKANLPPQVDSRGLPVGTPVVASDNTAPPASTVRNAPDKPVVVNN